MDIMERMKKPASKIAVWGDSITKGIIQSFGNKQYMVNPENSLKIAGEKLGIKIINHSYFGCTVSKGKDVLIHDIEKNIDCDAAILEFGGNDCDFNWTEVSEHPEKEHEPHTPLHIFSETIQFMIKTLREHNVTPILMTLVPLVPERYFSFISKNLNPANILKWLGDIGFIYRWHESYSCEIFDIARNTGCLLLDIRKQFLMDRNYQRFICEDGIHPNKEGQKFMQNFFIESSKSDRFMLPSAQVR